MLSGIVHVCSSMSLCACQSVLYLHSVKVCACVCGMGWGGQEWTGTYYTCTVIYSAFTLAAGHGTACLLSVM